MKITEGIGLAFSRPWQFFKESFFGGKELVPIEEDPVGEFLDKKKGGLVPGEEEENEAPPTTGETAQAVAVVAVNKARYEKVEAVKAVAVSEAGNGGSGANGVAQSRFQVLLAAGARADPARLSLVSRGPSAPLAHCLERGQSVAFIGPTFDPFQPEAASLPGVGPTV